jgi:hypothetical protein
MSGKIRNLRYQQVTCQRDLTGANAFGSSVQIYPWTIAPGDRGLISRSYMRFLTSLTKANGNPLDVSDGVTFAPNPVAAAYERIELRLNNQILQYYDSNFTAVSDTLIKRQQKSASEIETTLKENEFFDADLDNRIQRLAADGVLTQMTKTGYESLGFADATTVALSAPGVLTFSAGPASSPTTLVGTFAAGDQIVLSIGGNTISTYEVAAVSLLTVTLNVLSATSYTVVSATALSTNPIWRIRNEASARATGYDLTFRPTDLFEDKFLTLPPGRYELWAYPLSTYKTTMVESKGVAKTSGVDYSLAISNVFFYVCTVQMPTTKAVEEIIMESVNVRQNTLPASTNQNTITVTIPPSTIGISVAFQDSGAGTSTLKPSTLLRLPNHGEKYLSRFNIQYASQNSNVPQLNPEYVGGGLDYRQEMWLQTKMNDNSYFNQGGTEKFSLWGGKNEEDSGWGEYFHHKFYKDPNDRSIQCQVTTQFSVAPTDCNQFVFAHHLRKATIKIVNGVAADVMVAEYFPEEL